MANASRQNLKMDKLTYVITILLLVLWGLGFFYFNLGNIAHSFLIAATLVVILKVLREK